MTGDQILLVVAVWALAAAALDAAARLLVPRGGRASPDISTLDRVLVAAPLAAGFGVLWTLAVGLLSLPLEPVVLAAGPLLWWLAIQCRTRLGGRRAPLGPLSAELLERFGAAPAGVRVLALTLVGLVAGCALQIARQPGFDVDSLAYHLPDVVGWLHSGHPGAVQTFSYDFPVGYYPVTGEVLLTWVLGISRSFAPLAAWSPAFAALALVSLWRAARVLEVPRGVAALALAAVATLPMLLFGLNLNGPGTDLPAVAWLACAAALSFGAGARPTLLGPALLAAGLAVGTKTTVAPLALAALLAGLWRARASLAAVRGWTLGGLGAALLVGAPWYVRNTLTHGWPLWPFDSGPTGDRLPHAMSLFHASFLSRPHATLSALGAHTYAHWVAGGLILIGGAILAPLLARRRAVLWAALIALAALLVWAAAPFTGVPADPLLARLTVSTLRYMLAALGACALALALAGRRGLRAPGVRWIVVGLLGAATVASLLADASHPYPEVPTPAYLAAGAGAGAVLGLLTPARPLARWMGAARRERALAASAAIGALAVTFLSLSAPHWLWRESRRGTYNAALLAFMLRQPGFAGGSQPISFAPSVVATLAGPALRHPIWLIPAREPCPEVRARLRRGWVVVFPRIYAAGVTTAFDAAACLRSERPAYDDGSTIVYRPL